LACLFLLTLSEYWEYCEAAEEIVAAQQRNAN
jgi:hypothetical protein